MPDRVSPARSIQHQQCPPPVFHGGAAARNFFNVWRDRKPGRGASRLSSVAQPDHSADETGKAVAPAVILGFTFGHGNNICLCRAADKLCVVYTVHPPGCPAYPTRLQGGFTPVDPRQREGFAPRLIPLKHETRRRFDERSSDRHRQKIQG